MEMSLLLTQQVNNNEGITGNDMGINLESVKSLEVLEGILRR